MSHGCCPAARPGRLPSRQSQAPRLPARQHRGTPRPHTRCRPRRVTAPHPALISAHCLAVPRRLQGQRSPLRPSLYTPVIFNSAYANPESGMSSGRGPRGNGHGANFLPFLPLFLYNIQQRFSSTA